MAINSCENSPGVLLYRTIIFVVFCLLSQRLPFDVPLGHDCFLSQPFRLAVDNNSAIRQPVLFYLTPFMKLTCAISSIAKLHRNNTCYSKSDIPKQIAPTAAVSKVDRRSPQRPAATVSSSPNTKHQCMFCRAKFEYSGGPQAVSLRSTDNVDSWTEPCYCSAMLMTLLSHDEWPYYRHCQRGRAPYSRQFIGSSRGFGACTARHCRWTPTSVCTFSLFPCIRINEDGSRYVVLLVNANCISAFYRRGINFTNVELLLSTKSNF